MVKRQLFLVDPDYFDKPIDRLFSILFNTQQRSDNLLIRLKLFLIFFVIASS